MPIRRYKYFFLLFVLAFYSAQAQLIAPDKVRSITVDDGLPQGFVTGIAQDGKGFIWISTHDGLTRYDGRNMKVFRHDVSDNSSLSSNIIAHLAVDNEDHIWLQYENREIDVFDPSTEKCRHLSKEQAFKWLSPHELNEPVGITEDDKNRICIIYFDPKTSKGRLKYFTSASSNMGEVGFPRNEYAVYTATEKNAKLWVCTNRSLYLSEHQQALKEISALPANLRTQQLDSQLPLGDIKVINNDRLLISNGHDSWIYSIHGNHWQQIQIPAAISGHTNHFVIGPDQTLYLNNGKSIYRLNPNRSLSLIWTDDTKNGYWDWVPMIDHSNILWAATNTFGVRLIDLNTSGFHSGSYNNDSFYDLLKVRAAIGQNAERTQVMAYDGRSCYDRNGNLWLINLPYKKIGDQTINPYSFARVFKGEADITTLIHRADNHNNITCFTFDDKNRCWAYLDSNYLAEANFDQKRLINPQRISSKDRTPQYMLWVNNRLCMVYADALQFFDPETKRSVQYKDQPGVKLFRSNDLLMAVPDPHNRYILWIATRGTGLIRFDMRTGHASALTDKDGIPNNTVYAIVPDSHGFLWCSSNKGIFRFNPTDNSVVSFTRKDGLQGNEFNRYQFLTTPDGHIVFGGTEGWTMFNPDSIKVDAFKPAAEITDLQVNNKELEQYPQWKNRSSSSIDSLSLGYNMNFLSFRFAGLQYNNPDKIQYRYMLTGIDKKWVNAAGLNSASYSNLQPGDYTFKVNASNTAGIWSDDIKIIHISITPPWWRTWWAYSLYAAVIFSLAALFFRYRLNQLRARQEIDLKNKEAEQLRAMDEVKSRFFSNITHEFRTPLSLIISPVEQLEQDKSLDPLARKKLSSVRRNAKQLLRLINQLLDLSKLESESMKVIFSRGDLKEFVSECLLPFKYQADKKHISMRFKTSGISGEYLFDEDKWEKIIYNLVSNAIKFTSENGMVSIRLDTEEAEDSRRGVHLQISDNGIGIPAQFVPNIFNRFYQADDSRTRKYEGTGIGLALVKELAELMNGTIEVVSKPGEGTIFDVYIPVAKAADHSYPTLNRAGIQTEQAFEAGPADAAPKSSNAPLILIVEDNEELCAFVSESLQPYYRTLTAPDGIKGLQIANDELPDIIISDVMMPGIDGFEFCAKIKSRQTTDHIAVILLTAKAAHESVIGGLNAGADDYITKPFHFDELQLRISNILSRQEKLRALFQAQLNNPAVEIYEAEIKNDFINQLYAIIDAHLDDPTLNVEKLASKVAVSHRTLNRKLAAVAGLSAGELIRQYRLKRSVEFLKAGRNVSEAAYSVGFETHSHFTTSFKAFFGTTPSEYLKE